MSNLAFVGDHNDHCENFLPGSLPNTLSFLPMNSTNLAQYWNVFHQLEANFRNRIHRISIGDNGWAFVNTIDQRLFYLCNNLELPTSTNTCEALAQTSAESSVYPSPPLTPQSPSIQSCLPIELAEFRGKDIKSIVSFSNFVAVLTHNNQIFYVGSKLNNLLTHDGSKLTLHKLTLANVVQLVACEKHVFVLTQSGLVYELVLSVEGSQMLAMPITSLASIAKIVAGKHHVLALRFDGQLTGWLSNQHGQLGKNVFWFQATPLVLYPTIRFVDIAAADDHSLLVTSGGDIIELGSRPQLGIDYQARLTTFRHPMTNKAMRIKAVMDHSNFSMAQTYNGTIFVWGCLHPYGLRLTNPRPLSGVYRHLSHAYAQFASPSSTESSGLMFTLSFDRKWKPFDEAFQLNDHTTADICLCIGDGRLRAHSRIVRTRSPYLNRLLSETWRYPKGEVKLCLDGVDFQCWRLYLSYLYDGHVYHLNDLNVLPLLLLANVCGEQELFDDCVHYVESHLVGQANLRCQLYELAVRFELHHLERFLRILIVSNLAEMSDTFGWNLLDHALQVNLTCESAK